MAAAFDPRLSPHAQVPNEIDFHALRVFLEEHSFADSTVTISPNVESSSICPHILEYKICRSLFTDWTWHSTYHPEFLVRHDQILWLPEHGSAAHYFKTAARRRTVQLTTVLMHMLFTGPLQSRWPSGHWHYALFLTILALFATSSQQKQAPGLYNASVH